MDTKGKAKRICTHKKLDHAAARKVLKQLKTNPEVCDNCKIKPCVLAIYIWGIDWLKQMTNS